jgi:hypothetical protein
LPGATFGAQSWFPRAGACACCAITELAANTPTATLAAIKFLIDVFCIEISSPGWG